ncbi:HBR390Cp [Eremothecium sinecaudum]|uniref:HBR390Cp n=1 Tax=Eremothecium sinecaudum TaxID=45286 RepID=A0A120K1F6_9SACH|nr:HBR390Cp [Eremothecium sinecaudum]AMD19291.1 HBR390Cp [Eremothecium sinecaudum]
MSSYTCNSCALAFSTGEDQRSHMKTDWHRYNLKRRVAQLPPIDEPTFDEKASRLAENETEKLSKKEIRRREKEALLERKKQLLEMAKHSIMKNMQEQNVKSNDLSEESVTDEPIAAAEETVEAVAAETELTEEEQLEKIMQDKIKNNVEIPLETCIFCPKRSFATFEENLEHMFKNHGFYIPEAKYLVDKRGLVKYLSEKVGLGNVCLCCSYQGRSLEAVRAHMLAKSHCRVPYETEDEKLEISEFYDFTSSYAALDAATNDDEGEWEDVDSDYEGSDSEELLPQDILYHDGIELYLPTGVKVGHRSMQRYYRQNIKPERELSEGQGTIIAADTRHLATIHDKQAVATQKRAWKTFVSDKKRDDKRAAKFINNQPHYRDQLLQ